MNSHQKSDCRHRRRQIQGRNSTRRSKDNFLAGQWQRLRRKKPNPKKAQTQTLTFDTDELPRADTSLDIARKTEARFSRQSSVTAETVRP